MVISYELEDSLYLNLTNRCSNDCVFCLRNKFDSVNGKDALWLDREPTVEEIKDDLSKRDIPKYHSVVFCGYGEPLMRFDDCIEIAKWLKEKFPQTPIRINTNGQANLIEGYDVTPKFKGIIDSLSISLNSANAEKYDLICKSAFGKSAFDAVQKFASSSKEFVPDVALSIVNRDMTDDEIETCRKIAENCGVKFKIREYIE